MKAKQQVHRRAGRVVWAWVCGDPCPPTQDYGPEFAVYLGARKDLFIRDKVRGMWDSKDESQTISGFISPAPSAWMAKRSALPTPRFPFRSQASASACGWRYLMSDPDRTPEQFRVAVAEKVMGWRRVNGGWLGGWGYDRNLPGDLVGMGGLDWRPDESANDDCLVLRHVRKTWPPFRLLAMSEELARVWCKACFGSGGASPQMLVYQPGDYARAALAVVEGEQS